jgi:hypothetical protein
MRIEYEDLAAVSAVVNTSGTELTKIYGFFNGSTATRYLQLYDAKAVPADNANEAAAVAAGLIRTWPLYTTAPFEFDFVGDTIRLGSGCVLVISTTKDNLTASVDTADFFVTGESSWNNAGTTAVGDYTTDETEQEVWATGAGPKTLLRVEFTAVADAGADLYAKIYGAAPAAGDPPMAQMKLRQNTSEDFYFHLTPTWIKAGVTYIGCHIVIDETPGDFVGTYAGGHYAIKSTYR